MRIAIDYNAALRQIAGIGRYTRELVHALADLRSGDELVLFYAARDLSPDAPGVASLRELRASYPAVRPVGLPISERWLTIAWQRVRLPIPVERLIGPIDVLHAPDFVLPPARTRRTILTVHDLTFRIHPETAHARLRRYLDHAVPRSLERAAHILADSRSTADDLQRLMAVPPERVSVLYPGIGRQFQRIEDTEQCAAVRRRYNVPDEFLLHLGTIEPRKNLQRLMSAFAGVRAASGRSIGLVLGGKPGWLSEAIVAQARATEGVMLIGPVAEEDVPVLYSMARGVAYPSLYEGFGFPPLEALACGTPVVASNTSSLPELLGEVALLVDPGDTAALAAALHCLLDDPEVTRRARQQGPARAARFTWPGAARQLLDLYRMLHTHDAARGAAATSGGV
jgi:glycosyltransferase involved in cell wall biosynthesis